MLRNIIKYFNDALQIESSINYIRIVSNTDGIHIRFNYSYNTFGMIIRYPELNINNKSIIELWKVNSDGSTSLYASINADYVADS